MSTRPLRHPGFWSALGVLVVNDHWLKGAGVLPGWLTGKLSDFAGLVVAHVVGFVLVRQCVGAYVVRYRKEHEVNDQKISVGVGGALSVFFFFLKTNQRFAEWASATFGKILVDPTDLIALLILSYSHSLLAGAVSQSVLEGEPKRQLHRQLGWAERLILVVASVACMATSQRRPLPVINIPEPLYSAQALGVTAASQRLSCGVDAQLEPLRRSETQATTTLILGRPKPDCVVTIEKIELETEKGTTAGAFTVHSLPIEQGGAVNAPRAVDLTVPLSVDLIRNQAHSFVTLVLAMKTSATVHQWRIAVTVEKNNLVYYQQKLVETNLPNGALNRE